MGKHRFPSVLSYNFNMSRGSWGALPDGIMKAVSERLTSLEAPRLVCKHWADAAPNAVKDLSVEGAFPDGSFTRNLSALQSFTWNVREELPRYDLSPLAKSPLKSLSIIIQETVPVQESVSGLEALTSLTSLTLHNRQLRILPSAFLSLTRLESLAIHGWSYGTSLKELERLPGLTALDLSYIYCSRDPHVLLHTLPPTIRSLQFGGTYEQDGGVELSEIAPCVVASLTSLDIRDCHVYDEEGPVYKNNFKTLEKMTSLETLVMRGCTCVVSLASLRRLRTLDLS
jgi:Leucine-rich repeat (LRR) protein